MAEGTSTNARIVTDDRSVVTRRPDHAILNGVTRPVVPDIIHDVKAGSTVAETKAASEAFATSTTVDRLPVVRIDGDPVGNGMPGPLSRRLRERYLAHVAASA